MKKLKFNSTLNHKQSDYKTHEIIVEKVITLYGRSFSDLKNHTLNNDPYIAENRDLMYIDSDDTAHVSELSLKKFQNWGIVSAGVCLTLPALEYRSQDEGCSLSDILEKDVPPKYYLSDEAMRKMAKKENLNS